MDICNNWKVEENSFNLSDSSIILNNYEYMLWDEFILINLVYLLLYNYLNILKRRVY